MEQTIKINVPEGKHVVYNESTQTIEFVNNEPIRSKSWEEFCENHKRINKEYYINNFGKIEDITNCNRNCKNNIATKEDAEGILALIQLTRLHDEWVGDWKYKDKAAVFAISNDVHNNKVDIMYSYVHCLLEFPTKYMANEFLNCFRDLIETAKRFI